MIEILTAQQQEGSKVIAKWFNGDTVKNPIFTLAGLAGTGKTYLIIKTIEDELKLEANEVAFITPTGKAASVLIQRGMVQTCTLHKLIYIPVVDKKKKPKLEEILNKQIEESNVAEESEKEETIETLEFVKKQKINKLKLIILDEVSMVSKSNLNDLLSYNIPILCTGDPAQLPPVDNDRHTLLLHPDFQLTEIVRQEKENKIIEVATLARNNEEIPEQWFGDDVLVINYDDISDDTFDYLLLNTDQIICGLNKTKHLINNYVRYLNGNVSYLPVENDKIICRKNNYNLKLDTDETYSLVNGLIGYVENVNYRSLDRNLITLKFRAEFLENPSEELIVDTNLFENKPVQLEKSLKAYILEDGTIAKKIDFSEKVDRENEEELKLFKQKLREETINKKNSVKEDLISYFEYGYCINAHQSQGSDWNNVVVIDESRYFPAIKEKWKYTAITRAKQKLVIITNFK